MLAPSRLPLVVLFVAGLLAACDPAATAPTPTPVVDDRGVTFDDLRAAVADVAAAQDDADDGVNRALEATRAMDRSVVNFLDPERIDDQVERWPDVRAVVDAAALTGLRDEFIEVALTTDRARTALSRAEARVDGDWEERYLAAQDDVLLAVRSYAEEADRVAQLLERHAGTYAFFLAQNVDFVERRFFFRTAEEAADAYATEVDARLDDLATAQRELAAQVDAWRAAGIDVNDATAAASRVYDERPSAPATDER